MKRLMLFALISILTLDASASDLIEVLPVTNKIIQLKFDDGYAIIPGYHQSGEVSEVFAWPLDVETAKKPASYSISSSDDANYATAQMPVNIGRKSKIHEISNNCNWDGVRCMNEYVQHHYIYIELPNAMVNGNEYTINLSALADNIDEWTFTYDVKTTRSVAIHTNQIGYATDSQKKFAYVSQWMGEMGSLEIDDLDGAQFDIYPVNPDGSLGASVFSGNMSKQKDFQTGENDFATARSELAPHYNFTLSDVWECDFSSFNTPGEYILSIENIGCSYPIRIDNDGYFEAFYYAIRSLYYNRSIIELKSEYAGKWTRPEWTDRKFVYTDVRTMDLTDESGKNQKQNIFDNFDWTIDLSDLHGYYHDAGDWDGYFSHFRVPRTLMHTYEMAPDNFQDGELNIPEEQKRNGIDGTHIPDILDEAVWLVDYFKNNVGPTGGIFGARVHPDISTTEGLDDPQTFKDAGFVFRDECRVEGIPSNEDCCTYIVHGEDPRDSYAFASIAAQYAYCLTIAENKTGEDYSTIISDYLNAAVSAYNWASNNTQTGDESVKHFIENRAAAAAWLYKNTGEQTYIDQLKADLNEKGIDADADLGESKWAVWAYVTIDGDDALYDGTFDATLQSDLLSAVKKYANDRVTNAIDNNRSMRMGGNWYQPVWNGQATTPWILPAIVAKKACEDNGDAANAQKYLDACYTTSDYFLGGNQLNFVWMTNVGHEHPKTILHHDAEHDKVHEFIPGYPPYSPRTICDWFNGPDGKCDYINVHDNDFCLTDGRLYPEYYDETGDLQWPVHELYFDNYTSPPGTEFTVHQNCVPAAAAYGFVTGAGEQSDKNQYPEIEISTSSSAYNQGENIQVDLTVSDDEWIYKIDLFQNNRFITTVYGETSSINWKPQEAGDFYLTAIAQDNQGLKTMSDSIMVTVSEDEDAPGVSITSPSDNGYILLDQEITIEVNVTGNVDKVKFYNFSQLIGQADADPFSINFTADELGDYKIRAVAINETSGLKEEAAVSVQCVDGIVLSSLKGSPGTLEPEFNPDINTYKLRLVKAHDQMPVITATTDMDASIRNIDPKGWDQRIYPDPADRTDTVWVVLDDKSDSINYTIEYYVETGMDEFEEANILFEDFGSATSGRMLANEYDDYSSEPVADFIADSVSINNWWQVSPENKGASGNNKLWLTNLSKTGDTIHFTNIDISAYSEISILSFWAFANTSWGGYVTKSPAFEISIDGDEYQKLFLPTEISQDYFDCLSKWGFVEIPLNFPISGSTMTFRIGSYDNQQWMIDDLSLIAYKAGCYKTLRSIELSEGELSYDPDVLEYEVELPEGTTTVPDVTALATNESASVTITDATGIDQNTYPDETDRTTTILVENCGKSGVYEIIFSVAEPQAISQLYAIDDVVVYPNPGKEIITIENINGFEKIIITDLLGRTLDTKDINNANAVHMNISNLHKGTYFIQLEKLHKRSKPIQFVKQ